MHLEMKAVCIFTAALKIKTILSCHCREVNTGSMFGPLQKITNQQILGCEGFLVGHKEALSEKVQKSGGYITSNISCTSHKSWKQIWA